MKKDHTKVVVNELPNCDFCGKPAKYDGKTNIGPWANMCQVCFKVNGTGLGLGFGQELVLNRG